MKEIDTEAVAYHIRGLLEALGDDPDREGLKETPQRVARMYEEVFEGMKYTNEEIAQMFDKTISEDEEGGADRYGDMVVVKDIDIEGKFVRRILHGPLIHKARRPEACGYMQEIHAGFFKRPRHKCR